LLRPTTTTPLDPVDAPEPDEESRGESAPTAEARTARPRRKRTPVGGTGKGRKLNLPDAVYDRLQLTAIQRRTTASAIAAEILDRNLPRLRIEREA
jgi:hypothetical protein